MQRNISTESPPMAKRTQRTPLAAFGTRERGLPSTGNHRFKSSEPRPQLLREPYSDDA
jgi:hypothetical protein